MSWVEKKFSRPWALTARLGCEKQSKTTKKPRAWKVSNKRRKEKIISVGKLNRIMWHSLLLSSAFLNCPSFFYFFSETNTSLFFFFFFNRVPEWKRSKMLSCLTCYMSSDIYFGKHSVQSKLQKTQTHKPIVLHRFCGQNQMHKKWLDCGNVRCFTLSPWQANIHFCSWWSVDDACGILGNIRWSCFK